MADALKRGQRVVAVPTPCVPVFSQWARGRRRGCWGSCSARQRSTGGWRQLGARARARCSAAGLCAVADASARCRSWRDGRPQIRSSWCRELEERRRQVPAGKRPKHERGKERRKAGGEGRWRKLGSAGTWSPAGSRGRGRALGIDLPSILDRAGGDSLLREARGWVLEAESPRGCCCCCCWLGSAG